MPRLYEVGGVSAWMYFGDHPPPHIHIVGGGGREAIVRLDPSLVVDGNLRAGEGAYADSSSENGRT